MLFIQPAAAAALSLHLVKKNKIANKNKRFKMAEAISKFLSRFF